MILSKRQDNFEEKFQFLLKRILSLIIKRRRTNLCDALC